MDAGDESGTAGQELFHRIDRAVNAAGGVCLGFETLRAGRAGLLFS